MLEFQEIYEQQALKASNYASIKECKNRRFNTGTCLICHQHFDVLLHIHAEEHGFKNAYEMIDSGVVVFDYEKYRDKPPKFKRKR